MTEQCKKRIENILNQYHPVLEPGEENITYEQAERLVEWLLNMGYDEDQAMDCLKYCTVGSDFVEKSFVNMDKDQNKMLDEACCFSRMTQQRTRQATSNIENLCNKILTSYGNFSLIL